MIRSLLMSAFIFLSQPMIGEANDEILPLFDAPFGLEFGMKKEDVPFPIAQPPNAKGDFFDRVSTRQVRYMIASGVRPSGPIIMKVPELYQPFLNGCRQTFDYILGQNYHDTKWMEWSATFLKREEVSTIGPSNILDQEQYDLYLKFSELIEKRNHPRPEDFRKLSIHTIKIDEKERLACLIFVENELSHLSPIPQLAPVFSVLHIEILL